MSSSWLWLFLSDNPGKQQISLELSCTKQTCFAYWCVLLDHLKCNKSQQFSWIGLVFSFDWNSQFRTLAELICWRFLSFPVNLNEVRYVNVCTLQAVIFVISKQDWFRQKALKSDADDCWRPWPGRRVVILPGVCRNSLIWCFCRAEEGDEGNFDSCKCHLKAERAKTTGCGRQIILANDFNGNSRGGKWHLREPVGNKAQLGDKAEEDPGVQTGLRGGCGGDIRQLRHCIIRLQHPYIHTNTARSGRRAWEAQVSVGWGVMDLPTATGSCTSNFSTITPLSLPSHIHFLAFTFFCFVHSRKQHDGCLLLDTDLFLVSQHTYSLLGLTVIIFFF